MWRLTLFAFISLVTLNRYAVGAFIPVPGIVRKPLMLAAQRYAEDQFNHAPKFDFSSNGIRVDRMKRMLECADSAGVCRLEEMDNMIAELKTLKHDCKHVLNGTNECNTDQIEGREILKEALILKRELAILNDKMREMKTWETLRGKEVSGAVGAEDHSFSHYVDYREEAEYESH